MKENEIGEQIIGAAMKVHSALGPGLLEAAYEACLAHELGRRNLDVARQLTLPVEYDGERVDAGFRLDMVVGNLVVVEVKAVEKIAPVHLAQALTYLRLGKFKLGYVLNFNAAHMRDGIKRVVNKL